MRASPATGANPQVSVLCLDERIHCVLRHAVLGLPVANDPVVGRRCFARRVGLAVRILTDTGHDTSRAWPSNYDERFSTAFPLVQYLRRVWRTLPASAERGTAAAKVAKPTFRTAQVAQKWPRQLFIAVKTEPISRHQHSDDNLILLVFIGVY